MTEFVVQPPPGADPSRPLYLAGDADALGNWRPDGVRLERHGDGLHHAFVPLEPGREAHYLVTTGRWRGIEAAANHHEIPARTFTPSGPENVATAAVEAFGRDSVRYHPAFGSRHLPQERTLTVFRPPGYDLEPARRYPVLYMHDGQNLFDADTAFAGVPWAADETAERVGRAGLAAPALIVGVANTPERQREYAPRRCGRGRADDLSRAYGRFLVDEVKPFIDAAYRTRPGPADTGVGGSSLGGLISLHLAKWYPGVFGVCCAMSPSLWWDREYFLRNVHVSPAWLDTCRVWLDMGGREGHAPAVQANMVRRARRLALRLDRSKAEPRFRYLEVPDAGHDEAAWAARFGPALAFLFPPAPLLNAHASATISPPGVIPAS